MPAVVSNIVPINRSHYTNIAAIYKKGMDTGVATFETNVPTWEEWNEKFSKECRFVVLMDTIVAGWAALSPVSKRMAYKGVAESTIYISEQFQGKGLGKILLQHLIVESEKAGYWTLQASIFPQNISSIRLHEKCGYRIVGRREKIAQRDGIWHDNILLEKRAALY